MALPKSVGTVGGGNMAEAILRGLLRAGMQPDQLIASDPDTSRREHLARELEIRVTESNAEVARSSELVVLAVQPAHVEAAAADLPRDAGPPDGATRAGVAAANGLPRSSSTASLLIYRSAPAALLPADTCVGRRLGRAEQPGAQLATFLEVLADQVEELVVGGTARGRHLGAVGAPIVDRCQELAEGDPAIADLLRVATLGEAAELNC